MKGNWVTNLSSIPGVVVSVHQVTAEWIILQLHYRSYINHHAFAVKNTQQNTAIWGEHHLDPRNQ